MKSKIKHQLILFSLAILIPNISYSQIEGTFDATGVWSFNLETPGINLRTYFFLNDKICFGPEFTFFFKKTELIDQEEKTTSAHSIDLNSHYLLELIEHRLGVYPLLGLNYTREKESVKILEETAQQTDEAWGVNVGIGIETPISRKINLFSEFIHTFSSLEDNVVFLGINYSWAKKDD